MPNKYHDGNGQFAANTAERERLLKIYQEQHMLPVTGVVDTITKEALSEQNKAVNDQ